MSAENAWQQKNPGWWFQTLFIFRFIYGMSTFPLPLTIEFHIFQDGYCTTRIKHADFYSWWTDGFLANFEVLMGAKRVGLKIKLSTAGRERRFSFLGQENASDHNSEGLNMLNGCRIYTVYQFSINYQSCDVDYINYYIYQLSIIKQFLWWFRKGPPGCLLLYPIQLVWYFRNRIVSPVLKQQKPMKMNHVPSKPHVRPHPNNTHTIHHNTIYSYTCHQRMNENTGYT